ncbi:50S ribosomal protein L15 [Candidatus Mycoplasma haematohominis]|uniref:Large ribosomal subunit protein uL15 n=1 Tax=Candidatus Mycoplasma haematohominis TaxID=1494318 RepID=A0A478FU52_9MOLU|nr:50S ribosomal protein L15 [Candidatus Mycoplasma haemohominis]GCE63959.1 50S ribosomal protein L15 [Candidatus Mycoplasma haemohominis]
MLKISPYKGARGHKVKRVGRGFSSGIGKTCTRGTKGQNARKSGTVRLGFEGGQMPLYRKVGKYGFNNYEFRTPIKAINIRQLESLKDIKEIDREILLKIGWIKKKDKLVKFIGDKTQLKGINIKAHAFSKKAAEVLKANGNIVSFIDIQGK